MTSDTTLTVRFDTLPPLLPIASAADQPAWLEGRAEGVTASEIHAIASGGRSTWNRILADKLNGSTFRGNQHTRRGHEREPLLIDFAATLANFAPNDTLYADPSNPLHRATPDALGIRNGHRVGAEAKSHKHGWRRTDIPAEHYDQIQFGMAVINAEEWLYVWEVLAEDGLPTLEDPHYLWVPRDEQRIAELRAAADAFNAWREAGAPEVDDLPGELEAALADWAVWRSRKSEAERGEKAAEQVVRAHIKATAGAEDDGLKRAGTFAGFNYAVTKGTALDEAKWKAAEPDSFAAVEDMRARVAAAEAAAAAIYNKPTRSTRLTITATEAAK